MPSFAEALEFTTGYKLGRRKTGKGDRANALKVKETFGHISRVKTSDDIPVIARPTGIEQDVSRVVESLRLEKAADEVTFAKISALADAELLYISAVRDHIVDVRSTTNRFVDDSLRIRFANTMTLIATNLALISGPTIIQGVFNYFSEGPDNVKDDHPRADTRAILLTLSFLGAALVSGKQLGSLVRRKLGGADELRRVHYDALDNRHDSPGTDITGTWQIQMRNAIALFGVQELLNLAPIFSENTLAAAFKPFIASTMAATGSELLQARAVARTKNRAGVDSAAELPSFPGNDRVVDGEYLRQVAPWYERTTLRWKAVESVQQAVTAAIALIPLTLERSLLDPDNRFLKQLGDSAGLWLTISAIAGIDYAASYYLNDPRTHSERFDQIRNAIFSKQIEQSRLRQTRQQLDVLAAQYEDKASEKDDSAQTYQHVLMITTAGFHKSARDKKEAVVAQLTRSIDDLLADLKASAAQASGTTTQPAMDPTKTAQDQMKETLERLRREIMIDEPGGIWDGQAVGQARVVSNTLCELLGDLVHMISQSSGPTLLNAAIEKEPSPATTDAPVGKDFLRKLEPFLAGIRQSLRKEYAAEASAEYRGFSAKRAADPRDPKRVPHAEKFMRFLVDHTVHASDVYKGLGVDDMSDEDKGQLRNDLSEMVALADTPAAIYHLMILGGQIGSDQEAENKNNERESLARAFVFLRGLDPEIAGLGRLPFSDKAFSPRTLYPAASAALMSALWKGEVSPKALHGSMKILRAASELADASPGDAEAGISEQQNSDNLTYQKVSRLFGPKFERALAAEYHDHTHDVRVDIRSVTSNLFDDIRNMPRQQRDLLTFVSASTTFEATSLTRFMHDGHHHDSNFSGREGPLAPMRPLMDLSRIGRTSSGPILNELGKPSRDALYYPFSNEWAKSRPKDARLADMYLQLSDIDKPRFDPGLTGIDSGDSGTSLIYIKRIQADYPWVHHVSAEQNLAKKGVGRLLITPPAITGPEPLRMLKNYQINGYPPHVHCDAGIPYDETKNLTALRETLVQHIMEMTGPASDPLASGTHRLFTKDAPPMDILVTIAHWVGLSRDTYPANDHLRVALDIMKDPRLEKYLNWDDSWDPCLSFMYKAEGSLLSRMGACERSVEALQTQGDVFAAFIGMATNADAKNDRAERDLSGIHASGSYRMFKHFQLSDQVMQESWRRDLSDPTGPNYRAIKQCMDEQEPNGIELNNPFYFVVETAKQGMRGSDTVAPGSHRLGGLVYEATHKFGNALLTPYEIVGATERARTGLPNKYEKVSPSLRIDTYVARHDNSNRRDRLFINTLNALDEARPGDFSSTVEGSGHLLDADALGLQTPEEKARRREDDCQRRADVMRHYEIKIRAFRDRVRLDVSTMADYRDSRLLEGRRAPGDGGSLLSEQLRLTKLLEESVDDERRKEIQGHLQEIDETIAWVTRNADGAVERVKIADNFHEEVLAKREDAERNLQEAKKLRSSAEVEAEDYSLVNEAQREALVASARNKLRQAAQSYQVASSLIDTTEGHRRQLMAQEPAAPSRMVELAEQTITEWMQVAKEALLEFSQIKERLLKLDVDIVEEIRNAQNGSTETEVLAKLAGNQTVEKAPDVKAQNSASTSSATSGALGGAADEENEQFQLAIMASLETFAAAPEAAIEKSLAGEAADAPPEVSLALFELSEFQYYKNLSAAKNKNISLLEKNISETESKLKKMYQSANDEVKKLIEKIVKIDESVSLAQLAPEAWLGDEHILADQDLLREELLGSPLEGKMELLAPSVAALLTYAKPEDAKQIRAEREMDSRRYLVVPVTDLPVEVASNIYAQSTHWSLLVIDRSDPSRPRAHHYDSLGGQKQMVHATAVARSLGFGGKVERRKFAKATNGFSCGDYVVAATRQLAKQLPATSPTSDAQLDLPDARADRDGLVARLRKHEDQQKLKYQSAAE